MTVIGTRGTDARPWPTDAVLWEPPRLAQAPDQDVFWNALVSYAGQPLPLGNRTAAVVTLAQPPQGDAFVLPLRFAAGPALLAAPVSFPFAALCGADLAVEDLAVLPPALREALHDAILTMVAAALPPHPHGAATFGPGRPWSEVPPEEGRDLRWFRATLQGLAPEPVVLDLGATLPVLQRLFGGGLGSRRLWAGLKALITREASFTLGRLVMSLEAFEAFEPGTVVVLDAASDGSLAQVRIDRHLFHFAPGPKGWTCVGARPVAEAPFRSETPAMPDGSDARSTPVPPGSSLDVAIDFDLGRVTVPLAELESWQPGSIVALQPVQPREGVPVTLRSNGRVIGTGDIVTVDDRIAVRVATLEFGR